MNVLIKVKEKNVNSCFAQLFDESHRYDFVVFVILVTKGMWTWASLVAISMAIKRSVWLEIKI